MIKLFQYDIQHFVGMHIDLYLQLILVYIKILLKKLPLKIVLFFWSCHSEEKCANPFYTYPHLNSTLSTNQS